ncbi:MAG TPA: phosphoribosylglycinamide formyltransferase [Candidatus Dormibacteraeota bacterium]|nr:phosphoribosylglycinamide formyltransferase [Candidatus Dormibacteraeota bacterium]
MKLGVLASGKGSNLRALVADGLDVVAVVTNRPECGAAEFARQSGIPLGEFVQRDYGSRQKRDLAMLAWLQSKGVEMIVLAGYDRVLDPAIVHAYPDLVLNIHPSLLPAFGGTMHAVDLALAAGVKVTGCSVHYCDAVVDTGPILLQASVPVLPGDTVETLHARIQVEEHRILPEAVRLVASGRVQREGDRLILRPEETTRESEG